MKIIGLTGKRRSGKDTVCAVLKEHTTLNVRRAAFADPLKEECAKALGITMEELEAEKATTFRPLLQWWGTEFRRNKFGDDYWVRQMQERLRSFGAEHQQCLHELVVVITDCRFDNEVAMVRSLGGLIVKTVRPGLPEDEHGKHVSESLADAIEADVTLINDGTLEEFEEKVLTWAATILN